MFSVVLDIFVWAKQDFHDRPTRFIMEVLAWATSIGCAITMALTIPNPPFIILYPLFIAQCVVFGWAAWTRCSFGMVGNYSLLVSIDTVAYIRLIS